MYFLCNSSKDNVNVCILDSIFYHIYYIKHWLCYENQCCKLGAISIPLYLNIWWNYTFKLIQVRLKFYMRINYIFEWSSKKFTQNENMY